MILSRGLLTFAFFGTDTFVPYALHSGRGASLFAGSVAVTIGDADVDDRHVDPGPLDRPHRRGRVRAAVLRRC